MANLPYGVLTGRPIRTVRGTASNAHFSVHLVDNSTHYRIAINIQSQDRGTPDLLFFVNEDFQHPITSRLSDEMGFRAPESTPDGGLDFIRGNLFDHDAMTLVGEDGLNDDMDHIFTPAMADETVIVHAFGHRWGPENNLTDKIFGFLPGNGIHDIHMNQGNSGHFANQDGVWTDGGLLIHFPTDNRWVAVFTKFQSQSWHTDDHTGHTIGGSSNEDAVTHPQGRRRRPAPSVSGGHVRIVGAQVGQGNHNGRVTLLNTSPLPIDLSRWSIADQHKHKYALSGQIQGGGTLTVNLGGQTHLETSGGLISLLDPQGLKIDGVSYTSDQAARPGWTIQF